MIFRHPLPRRDVVRGALVAFSAMALGNVTNAAAAASRLSSGIDPRDFGARFNGRTDDTAAWQAAIDKAARTGIPLVCGSRGTSLIRCRPEPRGSYGGSSTLVYQALDIDRSNLAMDLGQCRIKLVGYGTTDAVNYAFGTAKNVTAGTLTNIRISNGTIDFDPTRDPSINKRAFYLIGVDGVDIDGLTLLSSGSREGATITLQNCRGVSVRNLIGNNITQGMNLAYVDDVTLENLQFDTFREAIDCDHKVTGLRATNLVFKNGGPTNQCLDLNSVEDAVISGITAQNVGNIAIVNYKTFTPPTYEAFVYNEPFDSYSPSKNVLIEGVRADTICYPSSKSTLPFQLGDNQSLADQSAQPLENITLRDVVLTNCPSFIPIELVRNAVLENITFQGATNPNVKRGCIDIRSDYPGTETSVVLRNVTVEMGPQGTRGVYATAPTTLELADVTVTGPSVDTARFFHFVNLEKNGAKVTLENTIAESTTGESAIAFCFSGSPDGLDYSIEWGPGTGIEGAFAMELLANGDAATRITRV